MPADFRTSGLEEVVVVESGTDAGRPGLPSRRAGRLWCVRPVVVLAGFRTGGLEDRVVVESGTGAGRPGLPSRRAGRLWRVRPDVVLADFRTGGLEERVVVESGTDAGRPVLPVRCTPVAPMLTDRAYRRSVRFQVSGIPVRVRWSFWAVALLVVPLPYRLILRPRAWPFLLAWLLVVFVTVLVHEYAHARVARRQGAEVSITLYLLGGFTSWTSASVRPQGRFWVAAAGSAAGFGLGGVVWLAFRVGLVPLQPAALAFGLENLWYVNLVWGALNWIPVRPLDGGQMLSSALEAWLGRTGTTIADVVMPSVTLAGGIIAFTSGLYAIAVFAGMVLAAEIARAFGMIGGPSDSAPPGATTEGAKG